MLVLGKALSCGLRTILETVAPAAPTDDQPGHSTRPLPTRDPPPSRSGAEMAAREMGGLSLADAACCANCWPVTEVAPAASKRLLHRG
jgi:hypothetical protein